MILLARQSRGLTQTDLTKKLHFSQGRLSKIEDGVIPATTEDIAALAAALDYPMGFFYRKDFRPGPFNGLYRRRKSIGAKFLTQFNAAVVIRTAAIDRLARKEAVAKSDLPQCDPDNYSGGPQEIAAKVRQYLGIAPGPIKNLVEILEDHGVIVVCQDFGSSKIDGVSICSSSGRPIIFLNSSQPKSRQVFTAIHELGHMIMHYLPRPEEDIEREGDLFTAEFAMPEADIRPQFRSIGYITIENLQTLKLHWNVSMAALLRRARDLGYVDSSRYTSLVVTMSSRGYRRTEPFDEFIKVGEPTFEKELIEFHRRDLGYSDEQIRELVDLNPDEFRATYPAEIGGLRIIK
jgi:Zn-dependent peptidase ImmA (M78 family)/transcriptional regulator with XRE-family HTH domain